jgi:peptidoglycan-associated lipoprotein
MRRTPYILIALSVALLALLFSNISCTPKPPTPVTPDKKVDKGKQKPNPNLDKVEAPAPEITLTVSSDAIPMGQTTTLSWDSKNATGVSIDHGIGTVEASGRRAISPSISTTYRATATGPGGSAIKEVRVTVTEPEAIPPNDPGIKTGTGSGNPPPPGGEQVFLKEVRDALFDYNQYNIRDDARAALLADALLLKKYTQIKILIEGHCDERGPDKYNQALGDRRAVAARDFLVSQGIDSSRIDTNSLGKESPLCEEHNEECWQKNRCALIKIQ